MSPNLTFHISREVLILVCVWDGDNLYHKNKGILVCVWDGDNLYHKNKGILVCVWDGDNLYHKNKEKKAEVKEIL